MNDQPNMHARQRTCSLDSRRGSNGNLAAGSWLLRVHNAVDQGPKELGDWLLTLRGGLCHTLADGDPDRRKDRRIILALSWLSIEPESSAPDDYLVPHTEAHRTGRRRDWETIAALRQILFARGLRDQGIDEWMADCGEKLKEPIADAAVWVNRSLAFDAVRDRARPLLTRKDAWDLLKGYCCVYETGCQGTWNRLA